MNVAYTCLTSNQRDSSEQAAPRSAPSGTLLCQRRRPLAGPFTQHYLFLKGLNDEARVLVLSHPYLFPACNDKQSLPFLVERRAVVSYWDHGCRSPLALLTLLAGLHPTCIGVTHAGKAVMNDRHA